MFTPPDARMNLRAFHPLRGAFVPVLAFAMVLGACAEEQAPPQGLLTDYANGVDAEFGVEAFAVGDPAIEIVYPTKTPYMGIDQQAGATPLTPSGVEMKVTNCELAPGKCAITCLLNGTFAFKSYKEKSATDNAIKDLGQAGLKTITCYLVDETGAGAKEYANASARDVRHFYVRKACKTSSDCASKDACAFEQCVSLQCFYSPKTGCCNTKWECGVGETCQDPGTASAKCSSCAQDSDCDDSEFCTTDKCDLSGTKGQCVNTYTKGCCTKAEDKDTLCNDGQQCTVDACDTTNKQCINKKQEGACCSDSDCNPGDPCLVGQCVDAECRYGPDIFKPDCCSPKSNPTCNDNNFCTLDECLPNDAGQQKTTDGVKWTQCKHSLDPNKGSDCCDPFNQTNECDDANVCTDDACINFKCVHKVVSQCCIKNEDCQDNNKCTQEFCAKDEGAKPTDAGKCEYPKQDPLCCESSTDCDDKKGCTSDSCNLFTSKCVFVKSDPTCCDLSSECDDGDTCTTDFCVNSFCVHGPDGTKPNCCTKSANCNDNNPCTIDTCNTDKQECQYVSNGDQSCCVGNNDCDDGDCATLDFCGSDNKCAFKADPTKCTANIDCDDGLACTKDYCDTTGACGVCKHDAEASCCEADNQCDDGNPCTINKCTDNKCEKSGKAGCCLDDKDALTACDDGNACTQEYCVNNTCRSTVPKGGCCATDKDCFDGDACTVDTCEGVDPATKKGTCKFAQDPKNPGCTCDPDKTAAGIDCNDNNECTVASCVGGKCVQTAKQGCCLDKFDCDDGNACTVDQCVFAECLNFEAQGDQALCCKKETENVDCAYLNTSCAKGACETQPDGSRKCIAKTLDVCTVQIGYCQDFSVGTDLKAMGWNPGDVKGTAKTNWKVSGAGPLGPDQHAMLDWTPTKTDYETCLQSPIIQAAGSKSITVQYDRLLDIVKEDTTFRIYGSLDGANVDWTKATLIDVITPKTDVGPSTVDIVLPPALTGSNGLRLAFCAAGASTANLTRIGVDNICVVKGGKPSFSKCPPNQVAKFNDLIAIPLKATDPDSDAILSFSLINAPKFVTLSSALYFWLDNSWNTQLRILPKDPADVGTHTITVKVSDGFLYSLCTFKVTVISESGYLVWRPVEVPSAHGEAIATGLRAWVKAQGLTGTKAVVQHVTDLSLFKDLSNFEAIYISLGVYPKKHVLTETEALPLKLFLQQGGKLYMEGGDTWAFDTQTSLHGFFHIQSAIDEAPAGVDGTLKGNGVYQDAKQQPIKYYSWAYSQNFTYNNGNDLLSGNLKVKETRNVLENTGGKQQFHVQVAHDDPSTYRTVASSILFSGLQTAQGTDKPQDNIDRLQAFFAEGFIDCVSDAQCDDGNKCTDDKCNLNKRCDHTQICQCNGAKTIACGETLTVATTDNGATKDVEDYNCLQGSKFGGSEYAVAFTVDQSRPVELKVEGLSNAKAKVFVLNGGQTKLVPKCDTNACFAKGGEETIKFAAAKGNTYYLVLDAPAGETAQAKFTVTCKQGEICNDLQDNNSNQLIDCKDLGSCCGDAACAEICDGLDNDCDGHIDEGCDADGDKFCDADKTVEGTPAVCPNGKGDCDDSDSTVNPSVKEVCLNGKDDNCNGAQDEEGAAGCKNYYQDVDEDKFGAGAPKCLCAPKGTFTATKGGDCNDADPKVNPVDNPEICHNGVDDDCTGTQNDLNAIGCTTFYTDTDQDGFGTLPKKCLCFAEGSATASKPGDCNDADTSINPTAKEICNGIDDDCDGLRDEGCDDDGDLYCDFDIEYKAVGADKKTCSSAAEGANLSLKCDEADAKITQVSFASYGQPVGKCGGLEQGACHSKSSIQKIKDACLGKNSCIIAATDAVFGKPCDGQKQLAVEVVCTGNKGTPPSICPKGPGDTDDTDPKVNPEGIEICDGKDNDSDFKVDEDCDDDGDDYCDKDMIVIGAPDVCPKGKGDCDDNTASTNPGVNENCATIGVDDDCSGSDNDLDADNCSPRFYDNDQDTYGTTDFKCLCKPIGLYAAKLTGDCNDYDKSINPGAAEICDNIDNNCNGKVNEGCDDDGDGYCDANHPWDVTGILVCSNGPGDCDDQNKDVNPGKAETCGNGLDDDCDGSQNDPNAIGCTTYYSDADGDSFGTNANKCLCVAEGTFSATKKGDCDDNDKDVNPIATEICNNKDDDCDQLKDENCDQDGDGWCDAKKQVTLSDACPKSRPTCAGEEYLNTCYTAYKDTKDATAAAKWCLEQGGHLAAIDEANENEVVRKAIGKGCPNAPSAYIGLVAEGQGGQAPVLQVKNGLVAHFDARDATTITKDGNNVVSLWKDKSGAGNNVAANGAGPKYVTSGVNGKPALQFDGSAGMKSGNFGLNKDITFFVVYRQRTPNTWGSIAHHGNRDMDWALEQSGFDSDKQIMHWQSVNDNTGAELKLDAGKDYVVSGRIQGSTRDFWAQTGSVVAKTTANGNTISAGSKPLYIGKSDANETSQAIIGEILYFNRALSDGERDLVIDYLVKGWEITGGRTWKWTDDNTSYQYTNWAAGEPNNVGGVEDRAQMSASSGKWSDVAPTIKGCYVCEVKLANYPARNGEDCNDLDKTVYPGATEVCDDLDSNCDGKIDNDCDQDKDGYCDATKTVSNPAPKICPKGGGDCDDFNQDQNPGASEICGNGIDDDCNGSQNDVNATNCKPFYFDADKDKFGLNASLCLCEAAGNYTAGKGGDCNDKNDKINPDGTELCGNSIDDDCSGSQNDENAVGCSKFFLDQDGDGHGLDGLTKCLCFGENQYTAAKGGDCNDTDAEVNQGGVEMCDNKDNDCDSKVDEGCNTDGDGYCTGQMVTTGLPSVCPKGGGDCNDSDPQVNPGHPEWCDGKDNNCDSPYSDAQLATQRKKWEDAVKARKNAEAQLQVLIKERDYNKGAIDLTKTECQVNPSPTCPDEIKKHEDAYAKSLLDVAAKEKEITAAKTVEKTEYDNYLKMLAAGGQTDEKCDDDGDDWCDSTFKTVGKPTVCPNGGGDCKDDDKNIHPGMQENCKTLADDNCDGSTNDENALFCTKFGTDLDGDTYYPSTSKIACICKAEAPLTGTKAGDCDDANKLINPGVTEICDNIDNDCDGKTDNGCDDDGDNYCDASMATIGKPKVCINGGGDCNDNSASINPGAKEICNDNIDQNCDGDLNGIDAVGCSKHYHDGDSDGWAVDVNRCLCAPQGPYKVTDATKIGDCDDTTSAISPSATEICGDGKDNNCNGTQNDLNANGCKAFYQDGDKDGYGGGASRCQCVAEGTYVTALGGDCNDNDATISPGAEEVCDNKDNNCNGGADEGCDNDNDGFCDANMKIAASATCAKSKKPSGTALVVNNADIKNTNVVGNTGKGSAYTVKCLQGYVAIGLDGLEANGKVSRYRLKCAKLNPDGSFGTTVFSDFFGTANSSPIARNCSGNQVLVGGQAYAHEATGELKRFTPHCKSIIEVSQGKANTSGTTTTASFGTSPGGQTTGQTFCTAGYAVIGIQGTFGPHPFNVGFVCGRISNEVSGLVPGDDCVDTDNGINPAAVEKCDDKDQDCDGQADNTCDVDLDGYCDDNKVIVGNPGICPKGGKDCDDANANVNPGKTEICDDFDNDCNGTLDDGCDEDGDDYCTQNKSVIGKPKVCPNGGGDCDDKVKAVNPGAKEVCDGIDNNCAAGADEICKDNDGDGYCIGNTGISGGCPKGGNDCDDTNPSINPGQQEDCLTEADDNCSGDPNDLNAVNCVEWFNDKDNDNWGAGKGECRCHQSGTLTVQQGGDCDDGDSSVNPAAVEICDGKNNDCNFGLLKGVQYTGQVISSMNVGSHGGGFHLFHKQYWYPQWTSSNSTTVRKYDTNYADKGSLTVPIRYIRQLSGDPKEDSFYVATEYEGIRKYKGTTGTASLQWTRSISNYAGGVTSDGNKVYAQRWNDYRSVYIINRANGALETTKQLQGDVFNQYNYGNLHAIDGKLYRGVYANRWVYRYDLADMKHDGLKFQVAPTVYTSAYNGKEICVSDTGNNVYCYEIPKSSDPVPGTNGTVTGLQPWGDGGGYHLFHKQFWIPQWTSGNTTVHIYNDRFEEAGTFQTGYSYIRQLAGDPNEDEYYSVTYSSSSSISRVRKQKAKTSTLTWEKTPSTYLSGVAVDGKNVFVMRHNDRTVWVLDKTNGNTVKTASLGGDFTGTMYGGLSVVNGKLYRASTDRWLYRYTVNLASSTFAHDGGKFQIDVTPYFNAWTGKNLCYGSTSGSIMCYGLPGDMSNLFSGTRNISPQSHGGGYHPLHKEYWSPGWTSGNTYVYRYNDGGGYLGGFYTGARYVRQVAGDPSEDNYYLAENYDGWRKRKGKTSQVLWSAYIGAYPASIATDGNFVYGQRYNDHRTVYKMDRGNGQIVDQLLLDKWYGHDSYGGMQIHDGKLYRLTYSQWVWRYDLSNMLHDGIRWQVAPSVYATALNSSNELCAASTGAPYYCYKLPSKDTTFVGAPAGMDARSHGGGYHPFFKEYWFPEWSGDIVYRYSAKGKLLGTFRTGQQQMMQITGERTNGSFYTANWGYGTITKLSGKNGTSKKLWTANIGGTVGGVAVDGNYVYAMRYNQSTLWYLDKDTGSTVKTINLSGGYTGITYGGLAIVQGKLLRGSSDRWVYRYDVTTGQFDGTAFQTGTDIHAAYFDDTNYCVTNNSYPSVHYCYPMTDVNKPLSDEGCDDDGDGFCDKDMQITAEGTKLVCPKTQMACDGTVVGGTCVKTVKKLLTWPEAQAECETWGGNLASLHGIGQAGSIHKEAASTCGAGKDYWIGMNDKSFGGAMRWSDSSPVDYKNWDTHEPTSKLSVDYFSGGSLLTPSDEATLSDWYDGKVTVSPLSKNAQITTGGQSFTFNFTGLPKPKTGVTTLTVRTKVWGDYGSTSEYANVYIEGQSVGNVGNEGGGDCNTTPKQRDFTRNITDISDGALKVQLNNTGSVGSGCTQRQVQVELIYSFEDAGGKQTAKWKLCYKATKDGFNSGTFHNLCNNKGPSFVIYTNDKGAKVGGFINTGWHSNNNYSYDNEAFMFSLTRGEVYDTVYPQYAIYGNNSYGPTWGGGHDLYVNSGMKNGYTYFGHSFKCPVGGAGSNQCRDYLFGNYSSWTLSDIEVYAQDGFTTPPPTDGEDYVLASGTTQKWRDVKNATKAECYVCTRPITGAQYGFGDDCEDGDAASNPNTPEVCDNKDNNCNGAIDEGCDDDGDKYCDASMSVVGVPAACPAGGNDCDDNDKNVNPGQTENCNTEYDDNCNGVLSENNAIGCTKQFYDGDGDGYGTAQFQCLCEITQCAADTYKQEFDVNADGWTFKSCTANQTSPTGCNAVSNNQGWQYRKDSFNFRTPKGVLYYGDPNTDKFNFGASAGTATSPKIKLPADSQPELHFSVYAGVEADPNRDRLKLRVYVDGKYTEDIWDKAKSSSRFLRCEGSGFCTPGSKILTAAEEDKINNWYGDSKAEWQLCYQMSVDGTSPYTFHNKCNSQGATMTVIEATNGYKFGGYAPIDLNNGSSYNSTSSGWLYSLKRDTKHNYYRYSQYGMYMRSDYGPTWGGGHDMRSAYSDMRYNGYTWLGHTYQCPSGYSYGQSGCYTWIAGQYNNWTSKEFEVYKRRAGGTSSVNQWVDMKFDLSKYVGKEVQFEFYFDTVNNTNNDGLGVFVDSFRVRNSACSKYTATKPGDCDDTKGYVYPTEDAEICDNKDNNCNGVIDEACDADGDGFCDQNKFVVSTAACPLSGTTGSKDCKVVVSDNPQYVGNAVNQNTHSHGGGYHPRYKEFFYPSWGSRTVYTYNKDNVSTGSFQTGQYYAMDCVGDSDTNIDRYYTANYYYYRIYAWNGKSNSSPWSYYLGYYASYVTTDNQYVYAMRSNNSNVYVLNKSNGSHVRNYNLSGGSYQTYWGYGGLVRLDKIVSGKTVPKLYRAAGGSRYIERFTLPDSGSTASFDGLRWQSAAAIYNAAFDGEKLWVSPNSSSIYGYTLKESTCIRGDDCNDESKAVNPKAVELCDDIDNNCEGTVDEKCDEDNDDYCKQGAQILGTPKTCSKGGGDCDDNNNKKNPGTPEVCDNKDNNCNGAIDEPGSQGCKLFYFDGDNDGYGVNSSRCLCAADSLFKSSNTQDCDDNCSSCHPGAAEHCDNKDNDCDKVVDEDCDKDKDGYCDKKKVTVGNPAVCPKGGQDCDDGNKSVNPGTLEICNNKDENCNGIIDENASNACSYLPNSISKCVAGQCQVLGCAPGYFNLNNITADGCECNGIDQHEPNNTCNDSTQLSDNLYDHNPSTGAGGTSVTVTGRLVQAPDEDWYRIYVKDNVDGGSNACDRFGVRARFLSNPNGRLRFQIFRGQCPPVSNGAIPGPGNTGGENKNNAICCGDTDFQWFTRFKNYTRNYYSSGLSEYGQCPCQNNNTFDTSRAGWSGGYNYNGYSGPYCKDHRGNGGECIPTGYYKTKCQDDSSWLYMRVYHLGGSPSCSNYKFEVTNGIYAGNHNGKNW